MESFAYGALELYEVTRSKHTIIRGRFNLRIKESEEAFTRFETLHRDWKEQSKSHTKAMKRIYITPTDNISPFSTLWVVI